MSETAPSSKSLEATAVVELLVDVTEAAGVGETAKIAVTVLLPDPQKLTDSPVVCFGKPGGGYNRRYYTTDLPGPVRGAQAQWHVARGWIFVAVDHLGVGDSTKHKGSDLNFTNVSAASQSAETQVLQRLQDGTLLEGYPSIPNPATIGIGQSMGGALTINQQGRYHIYDGMAILGYGAIQTLPPTKPGSPPFEPPWWPRDRVGGIPIRHTPISGDSKLGTDMSWSFYYDDVDPEIVASDMARFARPLDASGGPVTTECPPWGSLTFPDSVVQICLTPGVVAPEAAAVMAPVLIALGERDVIPDPKGEIRAYLSATSVDLFICPKLGHMHNFGGTRELFWRRLEIWAEWVREAKKSGLGK